MIEVYLDNASTTKPWAQVQAVVASMMSDQFGNTSSLHNRGLKAARKVNEAAGYIKKLVNSENWNVVFTSGGSESDTTAVLGSVPKGKRDTVITTTVEHAAIQDSCKSIVSKGGRVKIISAGKTGVVNPNDIASEIDERTALVTVTHVANEMGTIQPINEIAKLIKQLAPKCKVHVDAVAGIAQCAEPYFCDKIDMVSISSHKIHGPQGVGALLLRPGVSVRPLIFGGDQQKGFRPGTLNLPGIAGFGVASKLFVERRRDGVKQMKILAEHLINSICNDSVKLLGLPQSRAPGMLIIAVNNVKSQVLLNALEMRGVLASSGSACHASRREPPLCLREAGLLQEQGVVRFSLTLDTTKEEIDMAANAFVKAVDAVRAGKAGES